MSSTKPLLFDLPTTLGRRCRSDDDAEHGPVDEQRTRNVLKTRKRVKIQEQPVESLSCLPSCTAPAVDVVVCSTEHTKTVAANAADEPRAMVSCDATTTTPEGHIRAHEEPLEQFIEVKQDGCVKIIEAVTQCVSVQNLEEEEASESGRVVTGMTSSDGRHSGWTRVSGEVMGAFMGREPVRSKSVEETRETDNDPLEQSGVVCPDENCPKDQHVAEHDTADVASEQKTSPRRAASLYEGPLDRHDRSTPGTLLVRDTPSLAIRATPPTALKTWCGITIVIIPPQEPETDRNHVGVPIPVDYQDVAYLRTCDNIPPREKEIQRREERSLDGMIAEALEGGENEKSMPEWEDDDFVDDFDLSEDDDWKSDSDDE